MSVINFAGDAWVSRVDEGNPRDNILRIAAGLARTAKGRDAGAGGAIYVGYDTRGLSCELAQEVAGVIAGQGVRARLSETYCPTAAVCGAVRNDPDGLAALMLTADSRSAAMWALVFAWPTVLPRPLLMQTSWRRTSRLRRLSSGEHLSLRISWALSRLRSLRL